MNLQERALSCAKWEWMDGMHTSDGGLVISVENGRPTEVLFDCELRLVCEPGKSADDYDAGEPYRYDMTGVTPAMTPATISCIEHGLLPKVWARVGERVEIEVACTHVVNYDTGTLSPAVVCAVLIWSRGSWREHWSSSRCANRIDALIECLEAAP